MKFELMIAGLIVLAGCGAEAGQGQAERGGLVADPASAGKGPTSEPPTDICSTVRLKAPDGVCSEGPLAACDPDCTFVPPDLDICASVFIIPDGACDPASTLAKCDPDCKSETHGAAGAPNEPEGTPPCTGAVIPDGKCTEGECDPDCVGPVPTEDECSAVHVISDGVCHTDEFCDPDCIVQK